MKNRLTYTEVKQLKNVELYSYETVLTQPFHFQQYFHIKESNFYWQNEEGTLEMLGFDAALIIDLESGLERFKELEESIERLKKFQSNAKVSPYLFGGFAFDPLQTIQSEWDVFKNGYFVMPSILFIREKEQYRVLTNYFGKPLTPKQREEVNRSYLTILNQPLNDQTKQELQLQTIERNTENYRQAVEKSKSYIKNKEADKIVIARSLELVATEEIDVDQVLSRLIQQQPNSFRFAIANEGYVFVGATPERLVKVDQQEVFSASIAGSIRRGKTELMDEQLGNELLNDPKNREEHHYVVEMIAPIFEKYCSVVEMPTAPQLLKMRDIQHLYTPIKGRLKEGMTIMQFIQALHPTPALGGVPTKRSMNFILELEQMDRGFYAGPVGWFNFDGDGEFAVAIRSGLIHQNRAYLFAGGGIVEHSVVEHEYEETWNKFMPMLRALGEGLEDE